jgi:hypothetical protein
MHSLVKVGPTTEEHIVMCKPISRQRLGKHILVEAKAYNNKTSITRQQISKHASLTTVTVFPVWFVQNSYKEGFS